VRRIAVAIILAMATSTFAGVPPDETLRAVDNKSVRLELDDARTIEGRLIAFDTASVTIVSAGTNEVVTISREHVQHVILAGQTVVAPPAPERHRMWGLHFGLVGTLVGDVDYGILHAFVSPNVLLPLLTESGEAAWYAGAVGAGVTLPLAGRWKLDAFAAVMPLRYTSFYTYLATGLGFGVHHTAANGLSVGFTLPLIGFAARFGHSPYGYDAPYQRNDSLGYFYLAGLTSLPLLTIGYRFACPCRH
jgi:small nuclear ribonucleoprotein (snRNP)-like protein